MWIEDIPIESLQLMADKASRSSNFAQAKSIYVCLIARLKKKYGVESAQLAANFFKLAQVYAKQGDATAAQTLYHRATEIWQNLYPTESGIAFDIPLAMRDLQGLVDSETNEVRLTIHPDPQSGAA